MRNAGRRHRFSTLKMYKVFSKSYRKQTKQASLFLLEKFTFIGFADVLRLPLDISFPGEGETYRIGPSPRLAGVPWNVGAWVQELVC